LSVAVNCDPGWEGIIKLDTPRWSEKMHLPVDYPRINQFQQWFTVEPGRKYEITYFPSGKRETYTGKDLKEGLSVGIKAGEKVCFTVKQL